MSDARLYPRWAPWFFLAPFLSLFIVFMLIPLANSVTLSLQQTYGPKTAAFVGLKNYADLLRDPLFWTAVRNTLLFAAGSLFIQLPISLGLALLLNRPGIRGRTWFRLAFFSPSLVGMVFVAALFALILHEREGLLNAALMKIWPDFPPEFPWLQRYVLPALIIAALWMYAGFNMVYFLAALQSVDRSLMEAARVDGAGAWGVFLHVTWPAIAPVASFVSLLSVIGSMQLFELPYLLLGGPGPESRGLTIVMYLYQNGFETGDLGYAAAIGWVLALFLMGIAALQRALQRETSS
jgi:ABC-type sugar transport system permease subunit